LRLRHVHVGAALLVEVVVQYLIDVFADVMREEISLLQSRPEDQWIDCLTEFTDGKALRRQDYYRRASWKELPLLYMLRDDDGEDISFCRDEETAKLIAYAQYVEVGRTFVSRRQWRDKARIDEAMRERIGVDVAGFSQMYGRFWKAVPECVWLTHMRRKLIGGSIVLPLNDEAYERVRSGEASDLELSPEADLQLPSRNLWIVAMTLLPELPKPKLPGVRSAFQMRKINQHGAVLLRGDKNSDQPVRILVVAGSQENQQSVENLGYTALQQNMKGTMSPMYEMVLPPPERSFADYSSPSATVATLLGTSIRLLRSD
jgi:hypothetical protein